MSKGYIALPNLKNCLPWVNAEYKDKIPELAKAWEDAKENEWIHQDTMRHSAAFEVSDLKEMEEIRQIIKKANESLLVIAWEMGVPWEVLGIPDWSSWRFVN